MEKLGISNQLIEQLPDAVFVVAADGTILFVNGQGEDLFGWDREELVGKPIETLVPTAARERHIAHRSRYVGDAHVRPMGGGLDLEACRKDGTQFPAEISLSALETEQGTLAITVVRDATDRLKTQAKFSGLLEAAPDAMLGVDEFGLIQLVNTQAERMFGWSRNELLGRPIETLVPDRCRESHRGHRAGYFAEPQVRAMGAGFDLSARRKDGTEFPVEVSLSSIETEDGLLVTAAVRDVSERKAFEDLVARARDSAERAARSRQEFLANMSHEIRTPMNAIIGMTSLLLDTPMDRQQRDFVETVRTSGEHLLTIINDILDYAKIDAGKLMLEELPFGVRDWLAETLELITAQALEKGLELACDVAADVPPIVIGDAARLRQVLVNLLSNAVKFTDSGEVVVRVEVKHTEPERTWLRIAVSDTGIGVAPGRVESLFEPFTQADSTTTRVYGGTGLGLAISRRLVDGMGGEIHFESAPGVGTRVEVSLPVGHRLVPGPPLPPGLGGCRVLVAEDNATTRSILAGWVRHAGMDAVVVSGGTDALAELATAEVFDFALIDMRMPGMDGCTLGRELRSRTPGTRLVLLDPTAGRGVDPASAEIFDAVLAKPVRQEKVLETMVDLLRAGKVADVISIPQQSVFSLPSQARRLAILIVEDTPVNQKVAQHLLARFGFRSDVAASGQEALQALEQRSYDLVLMDVQMPEMDGLEATRLIRERWPERNINIVAMTANVAREDVQRCLEAGMDGFLPKPIEVSELAGMLQDLVSVTPGVPAGGVNGQVVGRLCEEIGHDTVRELADSFLADVEAAGEEMHSACRERDRGRLAAVAHRLKTPARWLGAGAFGDYLEELERASAEAEWDRLEDMVRQVVQHRTGLDAELSAELAG